jgi:hypothetical protein
MHEAILPDVPPSRTSRFLGRFFERPSVMGGGVSVCILLLLVIELSLHTDGFLYRYRSVFAVGRAMDKLLYVEQSPPQILILGNSRVDNGFDPNTLTRLASARTGITAFNLGLPGANARIMYGILVRLDRQHKLGASGTKKVIVGLDESFLQADDSLGYAVFFADADALFRNHEYRDVFSSYFRLWGYSSNFKELREPEKTLRFLSATFRPIEPVGGGAAERLGYRPGFGGGFQDLDQISRQEVGSRAPPDAMTLKYFWESIRLLKHAHVDVVIVFPPLLNRDVAYLVNEPWARPYREIRRQLDDIGIAQIALEPGKPKNPHEFMNAGHLNDRGAQRYTRLLRTELTRYWPELSGPSAQ